MESRNILEYKARGLKMRIFVCRLKLNNFLTFSSFVGYSVIGGVSYQVYKPQPYIHNYSLMYGFTGLLYASLASPRKHVNEIEYKFLDSIEKKLYVYPARPRTLRIKRTLCNVKGEGYVELVQPKPKSVYPWHVAHIYFAPGSVFETVAIVFDEGVKIPRTIRIGVKRQGVFEVTCSEAKISDKAISGFTDPVNLGDMERFGLKPDSYVIVLSTKTRRKGIPHSNIIVKAFYNKPVIRVIEGIIEGEKSVFHLPIPFLR